MISVAPIPGMTTAKSGARARWSLAYLELTETPPDLTQKHGRYIEELDISNNRVSYPLHINDFFIWHFVIEHITIKDLRFLSEFPLLNTLVADHNNIHSHVKIPFLPNLHTIWMNHNKIKNLGMFISTLSKNCPNLRYLSLMNNEAAPSYFNGGTLQQYKEFRQFVISSLPYLEHLDFQPVTPEEREEANKVYGVYRVKRQTSNKSKKES